MTNQRIEKWGTGSLGNKQENAPESAGPALGNSASAEAPTQLTELTGVFAKLHDATRQVEELKRSHAGGFEVALENLQEGQYHIGPINKQRLDGLVENLRNNPLSSPIAVRETSSPGVFEIVAGRHRVQAFRILGHATIPAVLRKLNEDETERVVFYDNLLAPNLSDYEKYVGFSRRQKSKRFTQEELALEAGVGQQWVSSLLAFDRLPEEARDLISKHPNKPGVGGTLFSDLAPLAATHAQKVVEAVQKVIDGKLSVASAPAWVRGVKPSAHVAAKREVVTRGKTKFAELRIHGAQCVVVFTSADDAREYGQRFVELLKAGAGSE